MSDPRHEDHQHETPIKTPKQLITIIALSFVVPIIVILLLAGYVVSSTKKGAGSDWNAPEQVAVRIAPVAKFELRDANAPKVLQTGEQVYKAVCATCHTPGAAGAPKLGDNAGWAARIKQGYDTVLKHAVEGIRAMPAKGGNPDLDDVEVARAVVYMVNGSGGNWKEPAAPAAPAQTAAAPAAGEAAAAAPANGAPAQPDAAKPAAEPAKKQ
jgi:cytochrome c5